MWGYMNMILKGLMSWYENKELVKYEVKWNKIKKMVY